MIRIILPFHLRTLAGLGGGELALDVAGPATLRAVIDALEVRYPMLKGTIRDHVTKERRAMLRFFVCEEDWSHDSMDKPLPVPITSGKEALWIVGAIAGG